MTGDDEKFLRFYRQHHPFLRSFLLVSQGGSVDAAISIGRLFRKYLIEAFGPIKSSPSGMAHARPWLDSTGRMVDWCQDRECVCASACALVWFGAVERDGVVGLHRPFTEDPAFKALTPAEASTVYRSILNRVTRYLDDMEVPKSMIDMMVNTGSSEIRWVDGASDGMKRPPSIAEWEDASRGSFTDEERRALNDLLVKNEPVITGTTFVQSIVG